MRRWQADGLLLSTAAIWGLAFVPQSWGMASVGPFAFTGLRFALGALIVAPMVWLEARSRARTAPAEVPLAASRRWLLLLGLGLLIFLGAAMQQLGMLTTTVTNAGFLTALYVPAVPVLGWLVFRRRPHWVVWPCAVGCVAGTWLLAGAKDVDIVVGDWWVIASSVPWALHVLLVGWGANRLGAPYAVALVQFVTCSVLSLLVSAVTEVTTAEGVRAALGAIAYTGAVSVGVGYTAQVVAQRHTHAADAALILSSETVFAALFGAWLAGDRLEPHGLAGCGLIFACILASQLVPLLRPAR